MPIYIKHEPSPAVVGVTSYLTGAEQAAERRRKYQLGQLETSRERAFQVGMQDLAFRQRKYLQEEEFGRQAQLQQEALKFRGEQAERAQAARVDLQEQQLAARATLQQEQLKARAGEGVLNRRARADLQQNQLGFQAEQTTARELAQREALFDRGDLVTTPEVVQQLNSLDAAASRMATSQEFDPEAKRQFEATYREQKLALLRPLRTRQQQSPGEQLSRGVVRVNPTTGQEVPEGSTGPATLVHVSPDGKPTVLTLNKSQVEEDTRKEGLRKELRDDIRRQEQQLRLNRLSLQKQTVTDGSTTRMLTPEEVEKQMQPFYDDLHRARLQLAELDAPPVGTAPAGADGGPSTGAPAPQPAEDKQFSYDPDTKRLTPGW